MIGVHQVTLARVAEYVGTGILIREGWQRILQYWLLCVGRAVLATIGAPSDNVIDVIGHPWPIHYFPCPVFRPLLALVW